MCTQSFFNSNPGEVYREENYGEGVYHQGTELSAFGSVGCESHILHSPLGML